MQAAGGFGLRQTTEHVMTGLPPRHWPLSMPLRLTPVTHAELSLSVMQPDCNVWPPVMDPSAVCIGSSKLHLRSSSLFSYVRLPHEFAMSTMRL
jgi:hypothetical protein